MFADCKVAPQVMARQEQAGLRFELVSVPRVCVDDSDPSDIYEQAATLRVTNASSSAQSLSFKGGSAGHFTFGVSGYAPAELPERVANISYGPLNPSKRTQERLDLDPGQSGIITGRSTYILKIIDAARRDMAALGQPRDDSDVVDYRVDYGYRVQNRDGQSVEGAFSQPLAIWIKRRPPARQD